MRRVLTLSYASMLTAAGGCGGHPWHYVQRAEPAPFFSDARVALAPVTYDDLHVGKDTEKDFLDTKDDVFWEEWDDHKRYLAEDLVDSLLERTSVRMVRRAKNADFILHINIWFLELGWYAGVLAHPAEARLRATLTDGRGEPIEEIEVRARAAGGLAYPKTHVGVGSVVWLHRRAGKAEWRLEQLAEALGKILSRYLDETIGDAPSSPE